MFGLNFNNILELMETFPDEQSCIDYLTELRWEGYIISPFDPESKVYECKGNKYKCKNSGKYFNVKTATLFDNTKIKLQKWFLAIYLATSHKKGISSTQLAKDIGITQKSAWFMLQRIRACFGLDDNEDMEGVIEADETFIGGKNKNRHADKKVAKCQGRSFKDKVPVLGLLERSESEIVWRPHKVIPDTYVKEKIIHKDSRIRAFVVNDTKRRSIQPLVIEHVKPGAKFISDEWSAYQGLDFHYDHHVVDHSKKEYVNPDDNTIHSNSIEGAWKILKNSIRDMYNWVSKKHMQKYVDEFTFRYNTKLMEEGERINYFLKNMEVRTTYKMLVHG